MIAAHPFVSQSMSANLIFDTLPDDALLRQAQLVSSPDRCGFSILPFSAATLWRMVKAGTFPKPVKVTGSITAWRAADVRRWLREHAREVTHERADS
jgi:prophage regulatory protein